MSLAKAQYCFKGTVNTVCVVLMVVLCVVLKIMKIAELFLLSIVRLCEFAITLLRLANMIFVALHTFLHYTEYAMRSVVMFAFGIKSCSAITADAPACTPRISLKAAWSDPRQQ